MGKIVRLKDDYKSNKKYKSSLKKSIQYLKAVDDKILSIVINLAIQGEWKEWSENTEIGTVFNFTEEMIRDTGDENISELINLRDEILKSKIKLENQLEQS